MTVYIQQFFPLKTKCIIHKSEYMTAKVNIRCTLSWEYFIYISYLNRISTNRSIFTAFSNQCTRMQWFHPLYSQQTKIHVCSISV